MSTWQPSHDITRMQTLYGNKARALVGSEIAAVAVMAILPHYRAACVDRRGLYNTELECRRAERRYGVDDFTVHYPQPDAFDHAPAHAWMVQWLCTGWQAHKVAQSLRATLRGVLQLRACQTAWNLVINLARLQDSRLMGDELQAQSLTFLLLHDRVHTRTLPQLWQVVLSQLQDDSAFGVWPSDVVVLAGNAAAELRDLCEWDPTAAGQPPHRHLPLEKKTPDFNIPAEGNVGGFKRKGDARTAEATLHGNDDTALDLAMTTAEALLKHEEHENSAAARPSREAAVLKGLVHCDLVGAQETELVAVELPCVKHSAKFADGKWHACDPHVLVTTKELLGTGGGWVPHSVAKG